MAKYVKCPNCNGGGVIKEYDDLDRYYLHTCSRCNGTGEVKVVNKGN